MKETVILNKKEQSRLMILNQVEVGTVAAGRAAELLGLSLHHVKRILAAYRKEGAQILAHGNRGGKPYNAPKGGQGDRWQHWHSQLTQVVILSTLVNF